MHAGNGAWESRRHSCLKEGGMSEREEGLDRVPWRWRRRASELITIDAKFLHDKEFW